MSAPASPWVGRAAIFIRAGAGIMLILGMSAFAGAALVGGLIGRCVQIIVGGMGIVYASYLKGLAKKMQDAVPVNRALATSVINMLGLPMVIIHFFPLNVPTLKMVTVLMFIGIGIASVISLMKIKAEEAQANALVEERI